MIFIRKATVRTMALFSANTPCIRSVPAVGKSLKPPPGPLGALLTDGIVHPLSLWMPYHHTGITKDLHMVRKGALADLQLLQHDTGALLSSTEQLQNFQPVGVAKGFKYSGVLSMAVHDLPSNQSNFFDV